MSDVVHLLWFAREMPEGKDDIELPDWRVFVGRGGEGGH